MRLKIKRKVRTSSSEQWTLFDLDQADDSNGPQNIGKVDLHYDSEMVYATLLIWSELTETLEPGTIQAIIEDLLDEMIEPIGVPADYSLDYFSPSLESYKFLTNFEELEEDEEEEKESGTSSNGNRWP
ncbi:MAG: hypothetical protein WCS37_11225 [Chloroflexota bacterium]|nr:hypothetical protein [Chloroflexota bacterium]